MLILFLFFNKVEITIFYLLGFLRAKILNAKHCSYSKNAYTCLIIALLGVLIWQKQLHVILPWLICVSKSCKSKGGAQRVLLVSRRQHELWPLDHSWPVCKTGISVCTSWGILWDTDNCSCGSVSNSGSTVWGFWASKMRDLFICGLGMINGGVRSIFFLEMRFIANPRIK